mgnify:CR=1 FL=1|jgi:hypothetical protein
MEAMLALGGAIKEYSGGAKKRKVAAKKKPATKKPVVKKVVKKKGGDIEGGAKKKPSAWNNFLKSYWKKHPKLKFGDCMKPASVEWKKLSVAQKAKFA